MAGLGTRQRHVRREIKLAAPLAVGTKSPVFKAVEGNVAIVYLSVSGTVSGITFEASPTFEEGSNTGTPPAGQDYPIPRVKNDPVTFPWFAFEAISSFPTGSLWALVLNPAPAFFRFEHAGAGSTIDAIYYEVIAE